MQWQVDDMKNSDYEPYRILGMIIKCILLIFHFSCSGKRTVSPGTIGEENKMILDKVLSDERSTAYASTIQDINRLYLDCKECNWYKSKQTILSEARLSI